MQWVLHGARILLVHWNLLEPYHPSFMPAINEVNRGGGETTEASEETEADVDGDGDKPYDVRTHSISHYHYQPTINCRREMFAFDKGDEECDRYMPDRLHPNAEGYELWSQCIKMRLEATIFYDGWLYVTTFGAPMMSL